MAGHYPTRPQNIFASWAGGPRPDVEMPLAWAILIGVLRWDERIMVIVDYLKNHPRLAETVSRWIYDEWGHLTEPDPTTQIAKTRTRLNDDRIPLALVAMEGEECVGTVSLYVDDLRSRLDLTPWLAALYVAAGHRNRGIGGLLISRVLEVARGLGVRRLYLHTETAEEYYRRKGWRFLFRTVNDRGEDSAVMTLDPGS